MVFLCRTCLILAVLEKRLGLKFSSNDVYLNVIGGMHIDEPASDLGIALALISSLTENQLSAAVVTIAVLAVMLILNILNNVGTEEAGTRLINNYAVRYVIDWISVVSRFTNLQYGILDWSAMLYYVSMTFIAIYLTVRVYERRRWA